MSDDTNLGSFDLVAEIGRFPPGENPPGRRAETLIKSDRLRVVLVTMRSGAELREHTAPGPIMIHALAGRFAVTVAGQERELPAGSITALAADVPHSVLAREDGAFLLTIAWPGSERALAVEDQA